MLKNTKTVYFVTPTQLSFLDMITIGGSEKKGDESKIGEFCSGLKYALAILTRNGVEFKAEVSGSITPDSSIQDFDRHYSTVFTIGSDVTKDVSTNKEYEVLTITRTFDYESFHSYKVIDEYNGYHEFEDIDGVANPTSISTSFGDNWELWQGIREIYANNLDEGGYITYIKPDYDLTKKQTVISLTYEEGSNFDEIWSNKDQYFLTKPTLDYVVTDNLSFSTDSEHLKIYKQGILVYEDMDTETPFRFNIGFGVLDERRILHDPYGMSTTILSSIMGSKNIDTLTYLLTNEFDCQYLINDFYFFGNNSTIVNLANELYDKGLLRNSLMPIMKLIKKDPSCTISGRTVQTYSSYQGNSYTPNVIINSDISEILETKEVKLTEFEKFKNTYNIDIEYPVVTANLKGSSSVFDYQSERILISDDFNNSDLNHVKQLIINIYMINKRNVSSTDVLLDKVIELIKK